MLSRLATRPDAHHFLDAGLDDKGSEMTKGGIRPGMNLEIAGPPGIGKTAIAITMAAEALSHLLSNASGGSRPRVLFTLRVPSLSRASSM